jgi:signal transduction histidine kinase
MMPKVEFPIRLKLLLLMSGVVLGSIALYLLLAIKLFRDDKVSLVYELNSSNVKTLALQVESFLMKTADKVKLLTQGHHNPDWVKAVFQAEPDLIAYTLYSANSDLKNWKVVSQFRNKDYLKLYNLNDSEVDRVREYVPIPFPKVLSEQNWVANATLRNGAPILTLAFAIEIVDGSHTSKNQVAVVDLRLDKILSLVKDQGIATVYITDGDGKIVAHPDVGKVTSREVAADVPIVSEAIYSPVAFQLKPFTWKGEKWLGSYARVGIGGLTVISQVPEGHAFLAAKRLIGKSILFTLFIFTLAFVCSRWFASNLTTPLHQLLEATQRMSKWELDESVHVNTKDEISYLARSFNAMASDLRVQRSELEANQVELERKVKERTAALESQKKQLAEVQDAMLKSTRLASVGELAGATAHEVLNPLNNMSIRIDKIRSQLTQIETQDSDLLTQIVEAWKKSYQAGGIEALQKEFQKKSEAEAGKTMFDEDLGNLESIALDVHRRLVDRQKDIEFLTEQMSRITRILNGMRSLSRVGGDRRPLEIHKPIEETILSLNDILEKRKVSLVKEFGAGAGEQFTVIADKEELVQVFSNLIRNSLYAIDDAKRRAGVVKITTSKTKSRVEIRISDNGSGIEKDHMARIFEPDFTTKSVEEGTGLGLSISRRLIRAFGGDIEIDTTEKGKGTTFLIWLPAVL